jgi:predicted HAD superfamily phosphohydrolase YqeG
MKDTRNLPEADQPGADKKNNKKQIPKKSKKLLVSSLQSLIPNFLKSYFLNLKSNIIDKDGSLISIYLISYGVIRFFLEYLREPDAHLGFVLYGLSMGQVLCLGMVVLGLIIYRIIGIDSPVYFERIPDFKDKLILLDMDGTLLADSETKIASEVRIKVNLLKKQNEIWLCSNNKSLIRKKKIAKLLGLPLLQSNHQKPNKKIAESINLKDKELLVIGDKILIDGVLARSIHADFIKIRSKYSKDNRLSVKIVSFFDGGVYFLVKFFNFNFFKKL